MRKHTKIKTECVDKSDLPLYLFHQGTNYKAYDYMGAHLTCQDGMDGVTFRVWAKNAISVSVVGDFNDWNENINVMNRISKEGVFELFIPNVKEFDSYKYAIKSKKKTVLKADPYAFHSETPSKTASKVYNLDGFEWTDKNFIASKSQPYNKPMNIYEVNLASFMRKENGDYYSYREYADVLVDYVADMGYTHLEIMPISEYPFDGSWGYQVTGYYSVTSRFGTPKDFMYLVDKCHAKGISVIVDWVPAHFPKDEHGLYEFDGGPSYEYSHWSKKENKGWGTRVFDWGKNEVQSFLVSNALFYFEKFHIDGLRVDAVASMLYLDYDKKDGEWIPNSFGGNYNLEAIAFFKKLNQNVFASYPNALMIAEESTSFPMITKPTNEGGLGFNFKWNMGWMNDVLSYVEIDPYFRSGSHNKITFSLCYAFSENYILPISHDEVVHGKKSLIDKMHGNIDDKFATLRAFNAYMFAHPGKKLSFMGNEFGQFREWDYKSGLEFFMLDFPKHKALKEYNKVLNKYYLSTPSLYEIEDSWDGFDWISVDECDNNLIAFKRTDKSGKYTIAIINFSGNDYKSYRLGVDKGEYKITLCTDDKKFGGEGRVVKKSLKSVKKKAHGYDNSLNLVLPRFTALYIERK